MLPKRRGRPTLETYDVLFELARGGMGVVYAARTKDERRSTVAIKWMSDAAIEQRKHVDMFLDEMWIASCVRHENVVEVLDAGEHEEAPFLVMEFVPGLSLLELLRGPIRPPLPVMCAILAATARGLHAAHETVDPEGAPLHIVHRDVSPHNVLVGFDGRVKVTDFGVAAARGRRTQTVSGEIKGKLSYMAPEQITREQTTDRRADVWALGVIAWEAFAGRKLFTGSDDAQRMFAVLRHPIPDLTELAPTLPASLAQCVRDALARDVEARIPTAEAFALAMEPASATRDEVAAWMRAHYAERERAIEQAFRDAAQREPTAVTAIVRKIALPRESHDPVPVPVAVPVPDAVAAPRPVAGRSWAPWIALALVGATALALVARFAMQGEDVPPIVAVAGPEPAEIAAPIEPADAPEIAPEATTAIEPELAPAPTPEVVGAEVAEPEPPPSATAEAEPSRPRRTGRRARPPTPPAPTHPPAPEAHATPSPPSPTRASSPERAGTHLLDNPFGAP
ncbi:MAG: protein kinase [Sandaracinus sp.]